MTSSADDVYKAEVLEPARAAGDQPPEDLRVRYRLREPLAGPEVAASVKQVRQIWRRARGQLKYRKLIDRLEAEHRELAPVFAAAERGDLTELAARLRSGEELLTRRRAEVRGRLLDAAGAVRMLAPGDLTGIARSGGVTAKELAWLARAEGVEVREPDVLPAIPPYAGYARAREALDVLGHRHLADFLQGERITAPIPVLGGTGSIDAGAVRHVAAEWARRARDTSSTNAETILIALKSADPADLLLYDVVERLRERHRQRASEQALLHHAEKGLGIAPPDARRLVFAVRREGGPEGGAAGRLRELLDAGNVHAAAELGATLDGDGDLAVLAAEARQRVRTAVELRERAAAEPDPDVAWRLLTDALHLVPDLPGADEHRRSLPPRPAAGVTAEVSGTAVLITWDAAVGGGGDLAYRILRREGGPPGPADEPLTTVAGGSLRDDRPPVNVPLYYGVVAARGEAAAPPATAGPVVIRPEPGQLALTAGNGAVTGRWTLPPEAAAAVVTRQATEPGVEPGRHRAPGEIRADRLGFTDHEVENGTTYHYRVAAVYLDEAGDEVVTRGVLASVTPNAPPSPASGLGVEADPLDPGRLLVTFDPPAHGIPEVLLLPGPPPWPYGAVIPVAEARHAGRPLPSSPAPGGGLTVRTRGGVLLVVTVSGTLAAVGEHRRHLSLPAPRGLSADRRGGRVYVGFEWPEGVAEVQVGFASPGGSGTRRLTRARYDADGGVHFAAAEDEPVEVSVAACAGAVTGSPATVRVAARRILAYDLERGRRTLVVTVSAPAPVRVGRLVLVLRPGRVMPTRAEDGEVVATWDDLEVPGSVRLTVPAPKRAAPYWLRCFAEDETLDVADPPIRRLQVN